MLTRSVRFVFGKPFLDSVRSIYSSITHSYPRNFRNEVPNAVKSQDEFDAIAEIESNMFNASSKKSVSAGFHSTHCLVRPSATAKEPRKSKPPKREPVASPIMEDKDLGLSYKKLNLNDPLLSKLILAAKSRKARDKNQQIVIEGRRLILDAIAAGLTVDTIIFAQKSHLMDIKNEIRKCKDTQIVRIPQQDLRSWSTLVSCPGVIAICRKPSVEDIEIASEYRKTLPISVICDNIREPNNLGSIIRTCAAIPCQEVLVTKGCCDPWDTKALRGGCGAQFNVAVYEDLTWDEVENRLTPQDEEVAPIVYIAESSMNTSKYNGVNSISYDKINLTSKTKKLALVIGGETHGVSEDAYRLFTKCNQSNSAAGGCLHIPMSPYVESLNTASAITLLLFEMRRKLIEQCSAYSNSGIEH